uniref:Carboxypeptidase regulatory-like domain-containing protein n=1 Tax=Parastrongyloides trichosuri TaxID=131310 RepID=A0A0N4ZGG2_PARTI
MVSKISLFTIALFFNLITVSFTTNAIITGRLKCNGTFLTGVKVSVCDGTSSQNPLITGQSDENGRFSLTAQLESSDNIHRVSIHHNCTLQGTKNIYTRQRTYNPPSTTPTPNYRPQMSLSDIELFNATTNGNFTPCN